MVTVTYQVLRSLVEGRAIYCQVCLGYGADLQLVAMQNQKPSCMQNGDLLWVLMRIPPEKITAFNLLTSGGRKKRPLACNHPIKVEMATAVIEGQRSYSALTFVWKVVNSTTGKEERCEMHCGNFT